MSELTTGFLYLGNVSASERKVGEKHGSPFILRYGIDDTLLNTPTPYLSTYAIGQNLEFGHIVQFGYKKGWNSSDLVNIKNSIIVEDKHRNGGLALFTTVFQDAFMNISYIKKAWVWVGRMVQWLGAVPLLGL